MTSALAADLATDESAAAMTAMSADDETSAGFDVHLDNFEGPFDLLLSLITKHKLDITEVALSQVTVEFIAFIKVGRSGTAGSDAGTSASQEPWDLDQTTAFLLVAATLLDLKAARLLPRGDVEDEDDLALLEARDLLFARLLQYRAFKLVASVLEQRLAGEARRHPRAVGLEERFATLLPDVLIGLGLDEFAALAARALEPKPVFELSLAHLHAPAVSVQEQGAIMVDRLRSHHTMTFRALARDSPDMLTTVARFLSLLELFREGAVAFDQLTPMGELTVRWTGSEEGEVVITDEFDGDAPGEAEATDGPDAGFNAGPEQTDPVLDQSDHDVDPGDEGEAQ